MLDVIKRMAAVAVSAGAVLAFGAAFLSSPAAAQDGKALYVQKICNTCHGPTGYAPLQPSYPKLGGQNADYIVLQLKAFKAQERKSGQSALMWAMAAQLNDKEMEAIAKWLQAQKK